VRRWAVGRVAAGAAGAAALALIALPSALSSAASGTAGARVLVSADEFSLVLSRPHVARGRVIVQLLNRGEDHHDLRLRRISRLPGRPTARWSVVAPGGLTELSLPLRRGRYRLWCSLPGHRALGMRATLSVSRRR
jgi:hypothetical protein